MTSNTLSPKTWPPAYTLRVSLRAKCLKLCISLNKGLQVVVPKRYAQSDVLTFINQKRDWILKHLPEVDLSPPALPEQIHLRALQKNFLIAYDKASGKKVKMIQRPNDEIILYGAIDHETLCYSTLKQWLTLLAKDFFQNALDELCVTMNVSYQSLTVRTQQTRWGSCSSDKSISLNLNLLFLPPELVNHVLIHELCHTIHMNHSSRFWHEVAKQDPRWEIHRQRLQREAREWIPSWTRNLI